MLVGFLRPIHPGTAWSLVNFRLNFIFLKFEWILNSKLFQFPQIASPLSCWQRELNGLTVFHYSRSTASVNSTNIPGRDSRRITMMLIIIIFVYLSTEIPFMVITALHVLSTRYSDEHQNVKNTINCFKFHDAPPWLHRCEQHLSRDQCLHLSVLSSQLCNLLRNVSRFQEHV